ncbi:hypothetical protein ACLI1A_13365 [Flavobacterium sp. RHBU_3]|uniref:hypothetical protein n=1 Tax=Flavobacterium sp. RHBU_3 TaxID=3391184 RepID=UPI00398476E3
MAKKINIGKLDVDVKDLLDNAQKTAEKIKDLKDKQAELQEKGKEASKQFVANAAALKSLEASYKTQQTALSAQIAEEEKLVNIKKNIKQAVDQQNNSENAYIQNNKQLIELKKQLRIDDDDYEKRLGKINAKIAENNTWLEENGSANAKLMTTMSDYKDQVTESFDAINVFNGGISGFVSRAQEAGGVGKLFSTSLSGMTTGIKGMGTAIASNPIGVLLAILGPLIQKLMSFPPITKAVEKAMAALGPIIEIVSMPLQILIEGIASVIEAFADFIGSSTEAGRAAQQLAKDKEALKQSEEALNAAMSVQEERNAKAKQDIDELMKVAKDQTKSEQERLKALEAAHNIEKQNLEERKKLSNDSYNQAVRQAALGKGLNAEELAELQKQGAAYAEKMMKVKGFTQEEIDALKKANIERIKLSGEEKGILASYEADKAKIAEDAAAKRQAAEDKRKQAEEAQRQKAAKAARDAIDIQKLELEKYIESQKNKAHTMKEELAIAEEVNRRKLAIINAEYKASDKSAKAKLELEKATMEARNEILGKRAEVAVAYAEKELQAYIDTNSKSLISADKINDELIEKEKKRLTDLQTQELAFQQKRFDAGLINTEAFEQAKLAIKQKYSEEEKNIETVKQEAEKAATEAAAAQKAQEAMTDLEIKRANAADEFELQRIDEEERHKTRIADLDKQLLEKKITEDQYRELKKQEDTQNAENEKKINQAVFDNKLALASQAFTAIQSIVGKESAAGKAIAVAQATIDTYKSAVAAYAAGMSLGGPVGLVMGPVSAGLAVAAGIANVKKITSTKTPKAEKGALFSIGGKRHSQGGTLFTGEDGTRFEAEAGEVIGVMNRNAARHFMAFNNTFPAGGGSAPNYFASGGIVSREVAQPTLNAEDLANRIAQANRALPAPVVAVEDIITKGNSYVSVKEGANF